MRCRRSQQLDLSTRSLTSVTTVPSSARRHLLSEDVIKLQEFQRRKVALTFKHGGKGEYVQAFKHKLDRNERILRDELKELLHLCQTPEDMVVAKAAICRYHEENQNVPRMDFKFGPLFMRLCYELNMEEMAADTIKDKTLKGFFPDSTSFNIVMDMLFTKGRYEMALEVLTDMRSQGVLFNKHSYILAFAICYKLNSQRSYRICTTILEEAQLKGLLVPRHAYCFAVALAIKQGDTEKAKSLYSQIMSTNRISQNLQVYVLALNGAWNDVLSMLTQAMDPRSPFVKKPEFSQEVVDAVQRYGEQNPSFRHRVKQVLARLQQSGQVTSLTLDEMLCFTPSDQARPFSKMMQTKNVYRAPGALQSALLSE
ncbi:pentatricopeptide repeat-containing protein 2, mitochondrial isoform X2 [Scleropages formosus]|uniref:pentatricopeptide repeat-containing protein 2, mitochondrial isoform X2 n=1 Tax=Scleropages formosus TaxID=113540 RepID=UPI0010FA910B|nr:pentatricopeptide repeat-containing protein 2, mitochondrial isoform X2 [Scleropages formosus]